MSDYVFLFAAYGFMWACLAWYMHSLSKKQKLLREEIRILKQRLQIRAKS